MREGTLEVWDADNHLCEPIDAFTRHLPDPYRNAIQYVEVNGRTKIAIRGQISEYVPNPTFEVIVSPGAWEGYFRGRNPEGKTLRELANPIRCPAEFREPEKRLRLIDEQGLAAAMIFPSLASLLEERMTDDIELTHAAIHAYNQWMLDDWTFDYKGRLFPIPIVTLPDVDKAVAELDWCVERGAKAVLVRPAPVPMSNGRTTSPGDPYFDPFWRRTAELGVPVMMHASDSGYARIAGWWAGNEDEYLPFVPSAFRNAVSDNRAIHDTICALICHGMCDRNPGVRIGLIENGASWLGRLYENLANTYKKMPGEFREDPIETFRRHFWVHPFYEDEMKIVNDLVLPDHILFGSDYPHGEGLAVPLSFLGDLEGMEPDAVDRIMGGNLRALLTPQPAGSR
jgi:predicted TIM-barrel fold metal-dependent hydrolase